MARRKATKEELEFGIGEEIVLEEGVEPEESDDEQFTGFAADEEEEDE